MGKRLVAGLGNPGGEYDNTRHNLGFRVVQELVQRRASGRAQAECRSLVWDTDGVLLAQPQTYMNRSGYALRCLTERHEVESDAILVVFDEVHLPLGKLRFRASGGAGGHNGMASVLQNLRTENVARLRLGVGPEEASVGGEDLVDYVLGELSADEREVAEEMVERAADACECWLSASAEAVMQKFN